MKIIRKIRARRARKYTNSIRDDLVALSKSMRDRYGDTGDWPFHKQVQANDLRRELIRASQKHQTLVAS